MQIGTFAGAARLLTRVATCAALVLYAYPAAASTDYLSRPEVRSFMEALEAEHGLELANLERIFGEVRHQPRVVRLIGPEPTKTEQQPVRSYPAYRARFLTKTRIASGIQYWEMYQEHLQRAQAEFGIPPEVILGILGVETAFGRVTGSFRVVDSLATIAFDGPRRQDYFRDELKEFLLLAHETNIDPLAIKGSYAGAMGLPQFMPSSYRRHAVDFDNDGLIDLVDSAADAIGSVASYLKAHGWMAGEVATVPVRLPPGSEALLVSGLQRVHKVAELTAQGAEFSGSQVPEDICSVVELPAPGRQSRYLAGFANFEAITRYNRSTFYATAVLELADAIHAARMRQAAAGTDAHAPRQSAM